MTEEQLAKKRKYLEYIETRVQLAATKDPREVAIMADIVGQFIFSYAMCVDSDTTDLLVAARPLFDTRDTYLNRHK